jgi:hypothetical protein
MAELGPPPTDIDGLRRENTQLRAELGRRIKSEQRAHELKVRALKTSGSLLFTLFDRKKIITNFLRLFETVARFSGPQEQWPSRDDIIADAKALSLSWVRFTIRRRTLMFLISLAAFVIPGVQIYLVVQQNEIIANQNKFFEIQVYDIVARSMTSGDLASKQMTGALLARSDLPFLEGIITEVFGADMGVALTDADIEAHAQRLRDAAFRGHLILGLSRAIELNGKSMGAGALHAEVAPLVSLIVADATSRVAELFTIDRDALREDRALGEEVYRYIGHLGALLRTSWSLATTAGKEKEYFATLAPLLERSLSRRTSSLSEASPLVTIFFEQAIRDLLVDLALAPKLGQPEPLVPRDRAAVDKLVVQGFERLKAGVGEGRGVNWASLKRLAEVP